MGARGPQAQAAQGLTVIGGNGIEAVRRPDPPVDLTDEMAEEWRKIVKDEEYWRGGLMLIMAEVSSEMGAELRAAASLNQTSVAVEVGRRLERLVRLEEQDGRFSDKDKVGSTVIRNESLYSGSPNPWDMFRSKAVSFS